MWSIFRNLSQMEFCSYNKIIAILYHYYLVTTISLSFFFFLCVYLFLSIIRVSLLLSFFDFFFWHFLLIWEIFVVWKSTTFIFFFPIVYPLFLRINSPFLFMKSFLVLLLIWERFLWFEVLILKNKTKQIIGCCSCFSGEEKW